MAIYDYSEYKYIPPNMREHARDVEEHMSTGVLLLELFDNRLITPRNIRDIKNILANYFDITWSKLERVSIYVSEYKSVFIWFTLFKINVLVDCD